jgi:hypothetical protein
MSTELHYLERTCGSFYIPGIASKEIAMPCGNKKDHPWRRDIFSQTWTKCGSTIHEVVPTISLPGLMKAALHGQVGIPRMKWIIITLEKNFCLWILSME